MKNWKERIAIDPEILAGKPVIKGSRISVEFVLGLMADGWGDQEVRGNHPHLTVEDLRACLAYAQAAEI